MVCMYMYAYMQQPRLYHRPLNMATARRPRRELFISYGREPAVNLFVQRLKKDLEEGGLTVWLDTKDIPAGSDWHGAIGSGLERCKAITCSRIKIY